MLEKTRIKKIGIEEHCGRPSSREGFNQDALMHLAYPAEEMKRRALDVGEMRLAVMDECGVVMQVLSMPNPFLHKILDNTEAITEARISNDALADVIDKHPSRFAGFASLALQDPTAAADELERCVSQLGFKGALVSVNLSGDNLDNDKFSVLWERAEALCVPLYLHPSGKVDLDDGCIEIQGSAWSWGCETGTCALRIIFSGVFDRFPGAVLIIGHMGETIPYALWRLENKWTQMYAGVNANADVQYKRKTEFSPLYYVKKNLMITTSGHFSEDALICAISSIGADRIMFSTDYPNEKIEYAAEFIEKAHISEGDREKICYGNAQKLLNITT